jgi:hypothetical protein
LINNCSDKKQPDTQNCEEVPKKEETKERGLSKERRKTQK